MQQIVPTGFGTVIHSIRLQGDPEPMAVTYGIDVNESTASLQQVATALDTAFWQCFGPESNAGYSLVQTEVSVNLGTVEAPVMITSVVAAPKAGASSSGTLPQNCAHLVPKRTATSGRRGRGRFYFPSVPEVAVDGLGQLTTEYRSAQQARLNTWLAKFGAAGLEEVVMVLLHQVADGTLPSPIPPSLVPTPVQSLILDAVIATQRRRLRR